ncbi:permease component [Paenibacillus swuensis]|uniref:Permease component n=1 Tax=Paenibacillus swuensis TaxID=1178515 RepID=A0A172TK99_9BACL|nr:ABC transporter permease [Paenibacillus swuensis]ANE47402.1 permease component [Paenibacillus swuensis]
MGFPLLRFLFRKMWNTRWLTASTLLGLLVAVAFTISIPMYADGALKRVIAKTLAEQSSGLPAGSLQIRYQATGTSPTDLAQLKDVDGYIRNDIPAEIGFPYNTFVQSLSVRSTKIIPLEPDKVDASRNYNMSLVSLSGLQDHVEITNGKLAGASLIGGFAEVMMLEEALLLNGLHIGDLFEYALPGGAGSVKVRISGAFKPKSDTDPFWYKGLESYMTTLVVNEELFMNQLLQKMKVPLREANWYYAFDLREIQTSQLSPLTRTLDRLNIELYQRLKDTKVDISFIDLLSEFRKQSLQLQTLLFTLAAPMLAMVFYYIAMNARQSLDKQKSDIAVLRSRGGSTGQIIRIYLIEGLLLGGIALAVGPFIGWFMAKSIGSASGFLTFVDRKSIPVGISSDAFIAGGVAVLIAVLSSVIPAVIYARQSIVNYKQSAARSDNKPYWQRWFLDIVLVLAAGYGWYLFNERQFLAVKTGLTTDQLDVQPFLFFVPALSIFALGLLFLRIFPWLLTLFTWMGRRFLSVPAYLTLTQLSRSANSYYPLMILLILTLGLGVYNSSAARTIDLNSTERTLYQYGTDVVVQTVWEGFAEVTPGSQGGGQGNGGGQGSGGSSGGSSGGNGGGAGGNGAGGNPGAPGGGQPPGRVIYNEPPFEMFRNLEGVEAAARVLITKGSVTVSGRTIGQGTVMGIDNVDFSKVAWFRNDLFPVHPFKYLNILGAYEHSVIISDNVAKKYQLKPGDSISIAINQQPVEFFIVGTLPYWPSQYPEQNPFYITNLDYIYDQVPVIPYEVWLKMKPGAKAGPMIQALQTQGIELASVKDVRNELVVQGKHPTRGGVFGILSLGFLVSVMVSLIGYILYWFFNLSGRVVQFGVLRAMGLSRGQLTGMLLLEQLFTAGLSIGLGIGIGKLTSILFLPFLQTSQNTQMQVPPFRVVFESKDTFQLYIVVAFMMITGAALLFLQIRRLRVHQAVKLGEER